MLGSELVLGLYQVARDLQMKVGELLRITALSRSSLLLTQLTPGAAGSVSLVCSPFGGP